MEKDSATYKCYEDADLTYKNPFHLQYKKMKLVLKYVRPGNALIDIGCGTGEFLFKLRDHFNTLIGIDISPHAIEFTKKRVGEDKNVILHQGELASFRFPDEYFNVCLCLDVLEHVRDLSSLLQEIYRILQAGGEIIVTVPNWYDIINRRIFNRNPSHVHTLIPWHWMWLLQQAGFKIRFYRSVDFPLLKSDSLSRKFPIFGMCVFIVASK